MVKKIILLSLLCFSVATCIAQSVSPAKKGQPSSQIEKIRKPTGPNGFGSLKIGMTKEQVAALQASDGVYLASTMTPYVSGNYRPDENAEEFKARLMTPYSGNWLSVEMRFLNGQLNWISIGLGDIEGMFEKVSLQISEKFGSGTSIDNRKDEQCIYKNGANFKLVNGTLKTIWVDSTTKDGPIETQLIDTVVNFCPSNLRELSVGEIRSRYITIAKSVKAAAEEKQKSLF